METLAVDRAAAPVDRIYVHFALGKAYADIGEHERSFARWRSGNALKRQQIDYDETAAAAQFAQIEKIVTPALLEAKGGRGDPSMVSIFLLGMPRSGTTLAEQILASHPQVHGAGELKFLDEILDAVPGADGKVAPYTRYVPDLDGPSIRQLGTRYVAGLPPARAGGRACHR